jgi:hypothetical protein
MYLIKKNYGSAKGVEPRPDKNFGRPTSPLAEVCFLPRQRVGGHR